MGELITVEAGVGLTFVLFYAFERYRTTNVPQAISGRVRYIGALLLYFAAMTLLYAILGLAVARVPISGDWWEVFGLRNVSDKSNFLIAALLMTVLLPRLPGLGAIDERLRVSFRRLGSMSSAAVRMSDLLHRGKLNFTAQRKVMVKARFANAGLRREDMRIGPSREEDLPSPQHSWTRIVLFWAQLEQWAKPNSPFYNFVEDNQSEYNTLSAGYTTQSQRAVHCFNLFRATARNSQLQDAVGDCQKLYRAEMDRYLRKMCDFIGRGILTVRPNYLSRQRELSHFGLNSTPPKGLTVGQFALTFAVLLFVAATTFAFLPGSFSTSRSSTVLALPMDELAKFLLAAMIACNYLAAVLCAVIAKQYIDPASPTVKWSYLISSLCAAILAAGISLSYHSGLQGSLEQGAAIFLERIPFLIIPFTSAWTLGLLIDRPVGEITSAWRTWQDGIAQATMTALAGLAAWYLLPTAPKLEVLIGLSALMGFTIGFLVPAWYRTTQAPIKKTENAMAH